MMTPILTKELSSDGFTWNQYSPRVATITNELTNFAQVAYFAFDSWDEAHKFGSLSRINEYAVERR